MSRIDVLGAIENHIYDGIKAPPEHRDWLYQAIDPLVREIARLHYEAKTLPAGMAEIRLSPPEVTPPSMPGRQYKLRDIAWTRFGPGIVLESDEATDSVLVKVIAVPCDEIISQQIARLPE